MLKNTLLSFVTVVGGVVAGCSAESAELQEPVVVAGAVSCADAAALLGVELGNREILARPIHPGTYHLDHVTPAAFTPVVARSAHVDLAQGEPEAFATLETHADHAVVGQVEPAALAVHPRVKGELGPRGPVAFELKGTVMGAHLDWAADLGMFAVVVERAPRAEIRLYAPEITGGADFDAVLDPDTGDLAPVTGLRICWGER